MTSCFVSLSLRLLLLDFRDVDIGLKRINDFRNHNIMNNKYQSSRKIIQNLKNAKGISLLMVCYYCKHPFYPPALIAAFTTPEQRA